MGKIRGLRLTPNIVMSARVTARGSVHFRDVVQVVQFLGSRTTSIGW